MQDVSDKFRRAVKHSHTAVSKIEVQRTGDPEGVIIPVRGGTFIAGSDDSIRRSISGLEAVDDDGALTPTGPLDLLDPFTTVIIGYRGIDFKDGSAPEYVQQGVYQLGTLDVSEDEGAVILEGDCYDSSIRAQRPLTNPFAIPNGTAVEQAIASLIVKSIPWASFALAHTNLTTPPLLIRDGESPWDQALKLAEEGGGYSLGTNHLGSFELAPAVTMIAPTHVWHFEEGKNADFWNARRRVSSDMFPNHIVVLGTNSNTSGIRGEAWDADIRSPTYRYGPYGDVPFYVRSERIASSVQAQRAAQGILFKKLGPSEECTFSAVPNPALELGDTVMVTRERMGLFGRRMIVTKIELPAQSDAEMTVTCKRSVMTEDQLALTSPYGI